MENDKNFHFFCHAALDAASSFIKRDYFRPLPKSISKGEGLEEKNLFFPLYQEGVRGCVF
jgi:hypothetical protein